MSVRNRKLVGTIVLLSFLALYALLVATLAIGRIAEAPPSLRLTFSLVAGLLWVLPAGLLLRWMQRPDRADG